MEKSRQGFTYHKIIDKPELKSPLRHLIEGSITLALWAVWIYWLLPVITLIAWALGLKHYVSQVFGEIPLTEVLNVLRNGGIGIIIITTVIFLWISYNVRVISKRKGLRRKKSNLITLEEIAAYMNMDPVMLGKVRESKKIDVAYKENKTLITV